ncbi:MAG: hypothetical protein M3O85_00845 [Acidobacteriota bacterium]|nr:hypothetical protein [Acidobacteriota bacterium]
MRRLLAIAILAALPAAAQIYGVPPSVTSITPSRSTPGVPASVTSLGPNGFGNSGGFGNRCCSAGFQFGSGRRHLGGGFGQRRHHRPVLAVPYFYYPYYPTYSDTYIASTSNAEYEADEESARTADEHRSRAEYSTDQERYGEHYTDYREEERRRAKAEAQSDEERRAADQRERERAQAEKSKSEEKPEEQEPATVLVFKDGHHQDLRGYAITGEVLYDLAGGRARKILLADLDLPATTKLNDQLGNDFRLPTPPPKQN